MVMAADFGAAASTDGAASTTAPTASTTSATTMRFIFGLLSAMDPGDRLSVSAGAREPVPRFHAVERGFLPKGAVPATAGAAVPGGGVVRGFRTRSVEAGACFLQTLGTAPADTG